MWTQILNLIFSLGELLIIGTIFTEVEVCCKSLSTLKMKLGEFMTAIGQILIY